ncbi:MAG: zinc transport system ATP-binding protein [Microgenomates group bacterium Gr01-1014_16]|nr:MAG: zinc transport system ATP-binding protein [Microgenomates group bacterium Gr01-1014_16]
MPIVQLEDITYSYNHEPAVEGVTLSIDQGDFVGFIGPNGSGKSTLIKIILGLLKPDKGKVYLFGTKVEKFSDWEKIGYVPQKAGLMPVKFPITVGEIVALSAKNKSAANSALEAIDMRKHKNSLITELSGGQQQRVFIARALATQPQLLILDEPTVGVDAEAQSGFYDLLKHLNETKKLTLILVSHDVDVVAHEVKTIVCINKNLVCHGPPKDIISGDFINQLYGKHLKFVVHGH